MNYIADIMGLAWRPMLPPGYIALIMAALSILAVVAAVRSFAVAPRLTPLLLVLRLVCIGAVATLLMGPSRVVAQPRQSTHPPLAVLLDTSASMFVADCDHQPRLDFAHDQWLSPQRLHDLGQRHQVRVQGFDTAPRALPRGKGPLSQRVTPGNETRLIASVWATVSRASRDGDVLVISDGRDTTDQTPQALINLARSRGTRIHTALVGTPQITRDLALSAFQEQDHLIVEEPGSLSVTLTHTGLAGAATYLRVRINGREDRVTPVHLTDAPFVEMKIPIRHDEPGMHTYELSVDPLPGERVETNNRRTLFVPVSKKRMRVLVLEGQPFWDTKFIAQALRQDERIELVQVTQLNPERRETIVTRGKGGGVPTTAAEWAAFDVVILGAHVERLMEINAASELPRFVANGGHLIFSRGKPYGADADTAGFADAFDVIAPAEWSDKRINRPTLSLTPEGRGAQWIAAAAGRDSGDVVAALPPISQVMDVDDLKPTATSLLEVESVSGQPFPVLATMPFGRGMVAAVLGEGLWAWRLSGSGDEGSKFYDNFWRNMVRWMVMGGQFQPGKQVSLSLSRNNVARGEPVLIDVIYRIEQAEGVTPRVTLIDPAGASRVLAMQRLPGRETRFRTQVQPELEGLYDVVMDPVEDGQGGERQSFSVFDTSLEHLDTSPNPALLRMLAGATGGTFLQPGDVARFDEALRARDAGDLTPPRVAYVWDRASVMVALLICLGVEWMLRRMGGLL